VASYDEQKPPKWKKRGAVVELGSRVRESAEEPGERDVGALVVLMCAKDKALGPAAGAPRRR
jgi:hypothetical protein